MAPKLQVSTFFDFAFLPDWARGFGTQANVTYLDTDVVDPDAVNRTSASFMAYRSGRSTSSVSTKAAPFSARLSYNKRGNTVEIIQNRGNDFYIEEGLPPDALDFSTSYNVRDNFTLFFDWTNILETPFRVGLQLGTRRSARAEYRASCGSRRRCCRVAFASASSESARCPGGRRTLRPA